MTSNTTKQARRSLMSSTDLLRSVCDKDIPTLAALTYEASCEDGGSHPFNPEIRLEGGGSSLTSRDHTQRYPATRGRVARTNTYIRVGSKNMMSVPIGVLPISGNG